VNLGDIRKIKQVLAMYGVRPDNDLGQNFLVEPKYLEMIIDAAEPLKGVVALEVGPGMGVLTLELSKRAREVIAVELDPRMVEIAKTVCLKCTNLTVKNQDIRTYDPTDIGNYKLVANIPYYLTSHIIRKFLEEKNKPKEIVLMVQKEVAQRICATPNKMTVLTISVQFYGNPKMIGIVPRDAFYPTPQVDSAIVKITPYTTPLFSDVDETKFFRLVKAGFGEKRKQLINSISGGFGEDKNYIAEVLKSAGVHPERRAETLTLAEWRSIYKKYYKD
jgi:16S rRNA (adenine1518-N6/adenine1519-N6)-dimethyltransferase